MVNDGGYAPPRRSAAVTFSGRSVCIVGMHYAPETTGNAPYTTAMARHLASLGAQVHVIAGIPQHDHLGALHETGNRVEWRRRLRAPAPEKSGVSPESREERASLNPNDSEGDRLGIWGDPESEQTDSQAAESNEADQQDPSGVVVDHKDVGD